MKPGRPPRARLMVMIPAELLDRLDVECELATIGRSLAVRQALETWLEDRIRRRLTL